MTLFYLSTSTNTFPNYLFVSYSQVIKWLSSEERMVHESHRKFAEPLKFSGYFNRHFLSCHINWTHINDQVGDLESKWMFLLLLLKGFMANSIDFIGHIMPQIYIFLCLILCNFESNIFASLVLSGSLKTNKCTTRKKSLSCTWPMTLHGTENFSNGRWPQ